ncbi:hypothetical protein C8Q76DRAFT_215307 [Earliella scabrosa]|nr:hypothetical protein C8Q76DRAFT_215307 [Earliella scabrosa]
MLLFANSMLAQLLLQTIVSHLSPCPGLWHFWDAISLRGAHAKTIVDPQALSVTDNPWEPVTNARPGAVNLNDGTARTVSNKSLYCLLVYVLTCIIYCDAHGNMPLIHVDAGTAVRSAARF